MNWRWRRIGVAFSAALLVETLMAWARRVALADPQPWSSVAAGLCTYVLVLLLLTPPRGDA